METGVRLVFTSQHTVEEVLAALNSIRINPVAQEYDLQNTISQYLKQANIYFQKEYKLAPRNRIDFLVSGGICIEVKKGKPTRAKTMQQLQRYTSFREIKAVILVVERNVNISREMNGKPCISFGLNKLWGVAL